MQRSWSAEGPFDLLRTLAPLRHATRDATHRLVDGALWRSTLTPDGPATYRLLQDGPVVTMTAWGDGAEWVLDGLPALLGDDVAFEPQHPLLVRARSRGPRRGRPPPPPGGG